MPVTRRWITLALACLAGTAHAADLELDRVVLSSGGVGYFEHQAEISGDARISLTLPLRQVDDVLKSLVVFDDSGRVTSVRLPGRQPLRQRFQDLPFDLETLDSPVALLNGLRGKTVRVQGPRTLTGRLLAIEEERVQLPEEQGTVTRHRVSLMTAEGLQQAHLEDVEALSFTDQALQAQVDQALEAIAAYRQQDTRRLEVSLAGNGQRSVRLGYVTPAPLWKASYRLMLAGAETEEGHLQGWAHLENMSGSAWRDVDLTLVSGNPVTFEQDLYRAYYVERPSVPVDVLGRVLPKVDTGAVERQADKGRGAAAETMPTAALQAYRSEAAAGRVGAAPEAARMQAAKAEKGIAAQFRFALPDPVELANGHSLMAPLIDQTIDARQLSLYQRETHERHPLASVRLTNDTDTALPPGAVTVYTEGAFAGDGRLDVMPPGDSRLLSYAVDQSVRVAGKQGSDKDIASGRIVDGVLHLIRKQRQRTNYELKALEERLLWLEHPRRSGWSLTRPREALVEKTADTYRLAVELAPDESRKVTVVLERPLRETMQLSNLQPDQIRAYAEAQALDPELRRAFTRLAELRDRVEGKQAAIERLEGSRQSIYKDQQRIRDNMARLDKGTDLYRRYLDRLGAQESQLQSLRKKLDQRRDELEQARARLESYVRDLDIGPEQPER